MHNGSVRSLAVLIVYLAVVGARPAPLPPMHTHGEATVSMVADDTDLDDDMLSGPCTCSHIPDDDFESFDCSAVPKLAFRVEVRHFVAPVPTAHDRLGDDGLFRPPRASRV
jgi:hypothetical protein